MAFEKIQALGNEKFQKILHELMRGTSAMGVARIMQTEWGDFPTTPEKTLTQQLNRLRAAAAEGIFGKNVAAQIIKGATPQIKLLENVSFTVIDRMEELAGYQRKRFLKLMVQEQNLKVPEGPLLRATNAVFNDYSQLLQDIQKMRFEMGLDDFKGPLGGTHGIRGASLSVTYPDGTNVQKQVWDAYSTAEEILNRRGIPEPPDDADL